MYRLEGGKLVSPTDQGAGRLRFHVFSRTLLRWLSQRMHNSNMAVLRPHEKHTPLKRPRDDPRNDRLHPFLGRLGPFSLHPPRGLQESLLRFQPRMRRRHARHDHLVTFRCARRWPRLPQGPGRPLDVAVGRLVDHDGWAEPGYWAEGGGDGERKRLFEVRE